MAGIKRLLEASKKPLLVLLVLNLVSTLLHYFNYSGLQTYEDIITVSTSAFHYIGVLLGFGFIIVVIWAGYRAALSLKSGMKDGGLTGSLVSLLAAAINSLFVLLLLYPMAVQLHESTGITELNSLVIGFGPVGQGISIVAAAVLGFIFGVVGGYFGKEE